MGVKRTSLIRSPMVDRYGGSMPAGMLHAIGVVFAAIATINITEEKLTEDQLEQYRQGRVRSAIAQ